MVCLPLKLAILSVIIPTINQQRYPLVSCASLTVLSPRPSFWIPVIAAERGQVGVDVDRSMPRVVLTLRFSDVLWDFIHQCPLA